MFHAPIAYCETASVFGEMTTFTFLKDRLIRSGDKNSLLALIMAKIDSTINTVVRQIGFSNFERRLHGMDESYTAWTEPKKRSVEELDAIWLKTAQELYGKEGEIFTYENSEHLWAYIPHFHSPFYVYGYAFGELLTQSLFAQRQRLGAKFEPLYLDLLRSGVHQGRSGTARTVWSGCAERGILEGRHHGQPGRLDRGSGATVTRHGSDLRNASLSPIILHSDDAR